MEAPTEFPCGKNCTKTQKNNKVTVFQWWLTARLSLSKKIKVMLVNIYLDFENH